LGVAILVVAGCPLAPAVTGEYGCISDVDCATEDVFHQASSYPPRPDYSRLRHDGATIWFESYDGAGPWVTESQAPVPSFRLDAVRVQIGVESTAYSAGITFGDLNMGPP
jgi:hypothetical protein